MPAKRLKEFLDSHNVKYEIMAHSTAYTAQEIASLAQIRGKEFAKSLSDPMARYSGITKIVAVSVPRLGTFAPKLYRSQPS